MTSKERGANIQAPSLKPSVDLAKLIELLANAVEASQTPAQAKDPKNRSLFWFDSKKCRLRIGTSAVLLKLFSHPDFLKAFQASASSGFIRDFEPPAFGLKATLGGELSEGNPTRLPGNVDKLMAGIEQSLDRALPTPDALSSLLLADPAQQLKQLAKVADASFKNQAHQASLQALAFDSQNYPC